MIADLMIATTGPINGLIDDEAYLFHESWKTWTAKLRRNLVRKQYYDQRNVLKDLGIAIPPHLTDLELVLGWPAKAVDVLARRCTLDRFVAPDVSGEDPFGVEDMWLRNSMHIEFPQTLRAAFKYSCSFLSVTKGDVSAGEPEVLVSSHSALYSAGLWDSTRRDLKAFLAITGIDEAGRVTEWSLFLRDRTIRARRSADRWELDRFVHTLGRVPVEVLPYDPDLDRPFGRSRISRAVMGLSDSALRTLFRMEVHAEFFSSPQRYAMGADESMFTDDEGNVASQWEAIIGRVWAAGRDPDTGEVPQLGQFAAVSPQPHTDQLRTYGAAFSAEASVPLNELGIVHDANPTSAQAIEAAERPLVQIAKATHDNLGPRVARAMATAVQIRDDLDELPFPLLRLSSQWREPEDTPKSASGDFLIKLVQAFPWMAESRVPLQQLGWDAQTIDQAWRDKRQGTAALVTEALRQLPAPTEEPVTGGGIGA